MDELLRQALRLTVVGMGMTFTAIGVLVVGMYLLTFVARERRPTTRTETPVAAPRRDELTPPDDRYLATAAAVAVAFAQAVSPARAERADGKVDRWSTHVRNQRLTQQVQRPGSRT